jgi:hypothetical protein
VQDLRRDAVEPSVLASRVPPMSERKRTMRRALRKMEISDVADLHRDDD